jgi:hypothetical protein
MSYGKTLELGFSDWGEIIKIGFYLQGRMKITYKDIPMGQYINWCVLNRLGHRPTWGSYLHTSNSSKSNKVTQSQFTTQGQSFEANLASLEVMFEQVLNGDQAMGSWRGFSRKGVKLWVDIFRKNGDIIISFIKFSQRWFERPLIKGL